MIDSGEHPERASRPLRRAATGPGALATLVALVALGAAGCGGPPPPTAIPSPSPTPPAQVDFLSASGPQWKELLVAADGLPGDHPTGQRLFIPTWHMGELPDGYEDHVRPRFMGERGAVVLRSWEAYTGAVRAWLARLREVGKEAGDPAAALVDRGVRTRLFEQVLPTLMHHLEDQWIQWAMLHDPSGYEITGLSPEVQARVAQFVNQTQELRFGLEDWGRPPPPPLVTLWMMLPVDIDAPGPHGLAVVDALRRAVRAAASPQELWWAGRGLLIAVCFSAWWKDVPWEERWGAMRELRSRMDVVPMEEPQRLGLLAHWISEATRLGRAPDRPRDIADLLGRIKPAYRELGGEGELRRSLRVGVDHMLVRMGLLNRGPWFDTPTEDHPLRVWVREVALPNVPTTPEGHPSSPQARELMESSKRVQVPPP